MRNHNDDNRKFLSLSVVAILLFEGVLAILVVFFAFPGLTYFLGGHKWASLAIDFQLAFALPCILVQTVTHYRLARSSCFRGSLSDELNKMLMHIKTTYPSEECSTCRVHILYNIIRVTVSELKKKTTRNFGPLLKEDLNSVQQFLAEINGIQIRSLSLGRICGYMILGLMVMLVVVTLLFFSTSAIQFKAEGITSRLWYFILGATIVNYGVFSMRSILFLWGIPRIYEFNRK
jgi:hypothetical protein